MKTLSAIIIGAVLFTAAASAQPVVTQISNAASASLSLPGPDNVWATLPNGSIAQGSYFTIYGNGFGAGSSACGANFKSCFWNPYPLPTQIQGASASVTIGANTNPIPVYLEFAAQVTSAFSQINAILPSITPVGAGTLTVSYGGQTSAPVPINVVASSFGTFSFNEAGSGPGVIMDANYVPLTPFHTAKPGQVVILWGTGLGPPPDPSTEATVAPCPTGCDLRGPNLSVNVYVGGQPASVAYAGRSTYTAEDQVVFTIPTTVTTGCYVSVAVETQTGGSSGPQVTSNFTTIAVDSAGGACRDDDGVNMNDIASIWQSKGTVNVASIGLLSDFWNINLNTSGLIVPWDHDTVDAQIGTFDTTALEFFRGFTRTPSVNSCVAVPYLGYPPTTDYGLGYVTYLDAGPALSIEGPLGTQPVPKNTNGDGYFGVVGGSSATDLVGLDGAAPFYYNSTPDANQDGGYTLTSVATGTYTVSAPGGANVSAFAAPIDISAAAASFQWTNVANFNGDAAGTAPLIDRNTPLSFTWTGGDPNAFVDITLIGSTVENSYPSQTNPEPAMWVECVAPTSAGSFTVPTYVLKALPPATNSGSFVSGVALLGQTSQVTAISPAPTGLDAAYLFYRFIVGYTVQWQ
jgi:uncharacterized protein (TIGR03437 family)